MIYDALSSYYDDLVKGDEATEKWVDFVQTYCPEKNICELACGSGEIANRLVQLGYKVLATDFSSSMIEQLHQKYPLIKTQVMDMRNFEFENQVEGIFCFCDSINYLTSMEEVKQMFSCVKKALTENGVFLFDMHSLDRLDEFKELYIEEGVLDVPYQWTIQSDGECIHQHFAFYTEDGVLQEQHVQTVFNPHTILELLEELGFTCQIKTDFVKDGIDEGEKYFIIARRKVC